MPAERKLSPNDGTLSPASTAPSLKPRGSVIAPTSIHLALAGFNRNRRRKLSFLRA